MGATRIREDGLAIGGWVLLDRVVSHTAPIRNKGFWGSLGSSTDDTHL